MSRQGPQQGWGWPLTAVALSIAALIGLYWDTAVAMVTIWYRSETFTHAFVVPPIAFWLAWRRRHVVAQMQPYPAFFMLIPMTLLALLWLLADLTATNSVTQLAFVGMLVLTVPALLGLRVAYAMLFPLCFMFFAVPIGEFLMPTFMEWTADFTVAALRWTGVPVLREGLQFVIPSGNWSVVEACSGIRYLIASVTVGALFAHLNYQSTGRRIAFVLVSFAVPIVANWLRAYMIVMMGHLSGNQLAVGVDHLVYGWVFFGVVIMLMFMVGARWAEPEPTMSPGQRYQTTAPGNAAVQSVYLGSLALMLTVTAWPTATWWWIHANAAPALATISTPALLGSGWQMKTPSATVFRPSFENPSAEMNAWYGDGRRDVGLYLGFYRNQDYSRKLVSSSNVLVTSADRTWSKVAGGTHTTSLGPQRVMVRTASLRQALVPDQPDRLLVWQIYWVNGTLTSNDYLAKVYSAGYRLIGRGDDSAVIVVYTPSTSKGAADAALGEFMVANFGVIDALLRQTKATR